MNDHHQNFTQDKDLLYIYTSKLEPLRGVVGLSKVLANLHYLTTHSMKYASSRLQLTSTTTRSSYQLYLCLESDRAAHFEAIRSIYGLWSRARQVGKPRIAFQVTWTYS